MTEPETYAEYLWRERTESGGEVDKTCDHTWTRADGRVSDFRHYLLYELPGLTPYNFCPKCGVEL